MRLRPVVLILFFSLAPAGCDSAEEPPPALQGRYEGTFTYIAEPGPFSPGGPVSLPWLLSLEEAADGTVRGTGDLGGDRVSVIGAHIHPEVRLEFTDDQDAFAGRFMGTLSDDGRVLEGVYNFSFFFINISVTLRLQ